MSHIKSVIEGKDAVLFQTLRHLKNLPPEERSVVAAAIYDPGSSRLVVAKASRVDSGPGYGLWNHAEHEALALVNGEVDLGLATVVTTLSPCVVPSKNRPHISCTELLAQAGVTDVHVGKIDERQASIEEYAQLGLRVTVTQHPVLQTICSDLDAYFDPNNRQTGASKSDYIDNILQNLPDEL